MSVESAALTAGPNNTRSLLGITCCLMEPLFAVVGRVWYAVVIWGYRQLSLTGQHTLLYIYILDFNCVERLKLSPSTVLGHDI